jgi:hypothetical protein
MNGRKDGRKDGSITISLRNFVDEGISSVTISFPNFVGEGIKLTYYTYFLDISKGQRTFCLLSGVHNTLCR